MPNFKKSTGFKMKGYSYPGKSPLRANGEGKRQPDKMDPSKTTKQKLSEDTQGKYYKDDSGEKVYIRPKGNSGETKNGTVKPKTFMSVTDPYVGEKKIYTTEGKPSKKKTKKKKTKKKKTTDAPQGTVEKVKKYIKTKKKDIEETIKRYL